MELMKPPLDAQLVLNVSFDETSGVLMVGYTARPMKLGAALAYSLTTAEATSLARALDVFANRVPTLS